MRRPNPHPLKVVTGVSIGAVNGACIVGAEEPCRRPRSPRQALGHPADSNAVRPAASIFGRSDRTSRPPATSRCSGCRASTCRAWTCGISGAGPASTTRKCSPDTLASTAFHSNTSTTRRRHSSSPRCDVESGVLRRFRNQNRPPDAEPDRLEESDRRVMFEAEAHHGKRQPRATVSLDADEGARGMAKRLRYYWDGGLVDNTPLGDAMEIFSDGEQDLSLADRDESLSADRRSLPEKSARRCGSRARTELSATGCARIGASAEPHQQAVARSSKGLRKSPTAEARGADDGLAQRGRRSADTRSQRPSRSICRRPGEGQALPRMTGPACAISRPHTIADRREARIQDRAQRDSRRRSDRPRKLTLQSAARIRRDRELAMLARRRGTPKAMTGGLAPTRHALSAATRRWEPGSNQPRGAAPVAAPPPRPIWSWRPSHPANRT